MYGEYARAQDEGSFQKEYLMARICRIFLQIVAHIEYSEVFRGITATSVGLLQSTRSSQRYLEIPGWCQNNLIKL